MAHKTHRLEKELSIAIGKAISISIGIDVVEGLLIKVIDDRFILLGCIDGLAFVNLENTDIIKVSNGRVPKKNTIENYLG